VSFVGRLDILGISLGKHAIGVFGIDLSGNLDDSNPLFHGKGELHIGATKIAFVGRSPRALPFSAVKSSTFSLDAVGSVQADGKKIKFFYRQDGKLRPFVFHAASADEAAAIVAALPKGDLTETQQAKAEHTDFAQTLSKVTPTVFVTPTLIGLNVFAFILMVLAGAGILLGDVEVLVRWGANYAPLTAHGGWWRLLTSAFLHFGIIHLVFNMLALGQVGSLVERLYGNYVYLGIYLFSAIASSLASLLWHGDKTVSAGASGAIFGVYGALLAYCVVQRGAVPTSVLSGIWKSTAVFVLYSLFYGLAHKGIDNAAHIGGLISGLIAGGAFACPLDIEWRRRAQKRIALGGSVLTCLMIAGWVSVPRYDDPDVKLVRTGHLTARPDIPVGETLDAFMTHPEWEAITGKDGKSYVNVRGRAPYRGKTVEAVVQFQVDRATGVFEVNAIELNGIPLDLLSKADFLESILTTPRK
jgi:membrane associated rhomboid family serine protease